MAQRLRPPPEMRFSPPEDEVRLKDVVEVLDQEPVPRHDGHRQIALFKRGPLTVALYSCARGACLPIHVVDGPVIIHVLSGALSVKTDQREHTLGSGTLLRLAGGVPHDLRAEEASQFLITRFVEGPTSHALADGESYAQAGSRAGPGSKGE